MRDVTRNEGRDAEREFYKTGTRGLGVVRPVHGSGSGSGPVPGERFAAISKKVHVIGCREGRQSAAFIQPSLTKRRLVRTPMSNKKLYKLGNV